MTLYNNIEDALTKVKNVIATVKRGRIVEASCIIEVQL
jgi:hypothetical protein